MATPILVEDIEGCGPRYTRVKQGFTNGISDSVIAGAVVASVKAGENGAILGC